MPELSGKQKRFLRALGQERTAAVTIGRAGLSDAAVRMVSEQLARRELIKVRLPAGPGAGRKQMAERVAEATGAVCAGVVGRTVLLYRPNDRLDPDQRVALPD